MKLKLRYKNWIYNSNNIKSLKVELNYISKMNIKLYLLKIRAVQND